MGRGWRVRARVHVGGCIVDATPRQPSSTHHACVHKVSHAAAARHGELLCIVAAQQVARLLAPRRARPVLPPQVGQLPAQAPAHRPLAEIYVVLPLGKADARLCVRMCVAVCASVCVCARGLHVVGSVVVVVLVDRAAPF